MPEERRGEGRRVVSIEAWWQGMSGRHQARVSDLSMGGCFMDTIARAQVGEFVIFALKLPTGAWLQLRGEVASVDPEVGFSLAFSFTTADEQHALQTLLDARG